MDWIDVKEKLPADNGWYLVLLVLLWDEDKHLAVLSGKEVKGFSVCPIYAGYEEGYWFLNGENAQKIELPGIVTYWTGLPNSPKTIHFEYKGCEYDFYLKSTEGKEDDENQN